MTFQYGTELIEFTITKSKRKTLAIHIGQDGSVSVKAPQFLSNAKILEWVETKADWIVKKRVEMTRIKNAQAEKRYVTGETFLYLGENYTLDVRMSVGRAKMVGIADDKIILFSKTEDEAEVREILTDWYVKQAKKWIVSRVRHFSGIVNEPVNRVTIKNQKKRWGSCSSARNLNFNWRLIMAPPEVVDYVVVHELSHLKQMNHSKEFWHEVEKVLPDYKVRKKWLDENPLSYY